jgi:hypothetical protein
MDRYVCVGWVVWMDMCVWRECKPGWEATPCIYTSPLQCAPQQNRVPSVFRPHVCEVPALTADQVPPPDTSTGIELPATLPSPSCP